MDHNASSDLTGLQQFRLDVMKALASIETEIDALQQAFEESEAISPERLKELRKLSRNRLDRFLNYHAEHIQRL